jgi:hypothetical protein
MGYRSARCHVGQGFEAWPCSAAAAPIHYKFGNLTGQGLYLFGKAGNLPGSGVFVDNALASALIDDRLSFHQNSFGFIGGLGFHSLVDLLDHIPETGLVGTVAYLLDGVLFCSFQSGLMIRQCCILLGRRCFFNRRFIYFSLSLAGAGLYSVDTTT